MNRLHKFKLSLWLLLFLFTQLLLYPVIPAFAYNQTSAKNYLQAHSNNAWSALGLAALGENASAIPSDYLKTVDENSAIGLETPILAITALGLDPKNFGNDNLVAKLENFNSNNQLGDASLLNDDIFGILALISAGQPLTDSVINDSKNFILLHQNSDGGWGYSTSATSDSNTTASAIIALIATSMPPSDSQIQNAFNYLKTSQNSDGGFTFDPKSSFGTESDTSSTAWAVWALNAAGISMSSWSQNGHSPLDYIDSNQTADGYFAYQPGAAEDSFSPVTTAYAVIALSGKTLPLTVYSTNQPAQSFSFRIEGLNETVCEGKAAGPTALDIVKNAADICSFTYNITQTAYGPYLNKIGNDEAVGSTGWLYLVNNIAPSVGAADYQLKPNDEVLWYFGDFGWQPTRLTLSSGEIAGGQAAQGGVEFYDNNSWQKLANATVYFGTSSSVTDSNGQFNLAAPEGFYKVYAQKDGYIRSNAELLKVGNPSSAAVNLSVNAVIGEVNGTTTPSSIAFIVEPSSLNFGDLKPGQTASRQLSIKNTGSTGINITDQVAGDQIFTDTLQLGGRFWKNFALSLSAGQNQDVQATITLPQNYSQTGIKSGTVTFWATAE